MTTIWLGGPPKTLFNPLSVLIVIGGAFVVISACVSLSEMGEFSTTIGLISTLIGLIQMPGIPSTPRQASGQAWRWPQ